MWLRREKEGCIWVWLRRRKDAYGCGFVGRRKDAYGCGFVGRESYTCTSPASYRYLILNKALLIPALNDSIRH